LSSGRLKYKAERVITYDPKHRRFLVSSEMATAMTITLLSMDYCRFDLCKIFTILEIIYYALKIERILTKVLTGSI
jgi:hypothetical protein